MNPTPPQPSLLPRRRSNIGPSGCGHDAGRTRRSRSPTECPACDTSPRHGRVRDELTTLQRSPEHLHVLVAHVIPKPDHQHPHSSQVLQSPQEPANRLPGRVSPGESVTHRMRSGTLPKLASGSCWLSVPVTVSSCGRCPPAPPATRCTLAGSTVRRPAPVTRASSAVRLAQPASSEYDEPEADAWAPTTLEKVGLTILDPSRCQ